ncbi:MAG: hypothetical protein V1779_05105 [bacterium]
MNKLIFFLTIIIISLPLQSQEKEGEVKTLFGNKEFEFGGYGCPEIKFTSFMQQYAIMVGGRAGWVIDHTFTIGGGGYGLVSSVEAPDFYHPDDLTDTRQYYFQIGYGGLFLEYTHSSNSLVHFTVNTLIGAGGASFTPYRYGMNNNMGYDNNRYDNSAFFVVEPGIGVELNIFKFFRIELGASYRYISGMDLNGFGSAWYNEPSANLAFKFGSF